MLLNVFLKILNVWPEGTKQKSSQVKLNSPIFCQPKLIFMTPTDQKFVNFVTEC